MKTLLKHKKILMIICAFVFFFSFSPIISVYATENPPIDPSKEVPTPEEVREAFAEAFGGYPEKIKDAINDILVCAGAPEGLAAYGVNSAYSLFSGKDFSSAPAMYYQENNTWKRAHSIDELEDLGWEVYISDDTSVSSLLPIAQDLVCSSSVSDSPGSLNVPIVFTSTDMLAGSGMDSIAGYTSWVSVSNGTSEVQYFCNNDDENSWGMITYIASDGRVSPCTQLYLNGGVLRYGNSGGKAVYDLRNECWTRQQRGGGATTSTTVYRNGSSVYAYGNNVICNQNSSGMYDAFVFENGVCNYIFENVTDGYSHPNLNIGNATQVSNTGVSSMFSGISSAIGTATAAALHAADTNAIQAAAQAYADSDDKTSALDAYISAISAALALSAQTQAEVSEDVKGIAGAMTSVLNWLTLIYNAIINLPKTIVSEIALVGVSVQSILDKILTWDFSTWFQQVIDGILDIPKGIITAITEFSEAVALDIADFKDYFDTDFSDLLKDIAASINSEIAVIVSSIDTLATDLSLDLDSIISYLSVWDFVTWFNRILDFIDSLDFDTWFTDVINGILSIPGYITTIKDIISDWSLVTWLTDILNGILAIPSDIATAIANLFVMSEAQEAAVEAQLEDTFSPFLWIRDFVHDFVITIKGILVPSSEPPKIPIHLGNNTSKYNWGGDEYILDLSFWAPYKPFADAIIIFFAWLFYLWHLYKSLPSLFWGGDGIVPTVSTSPEIKGFNIH